MSTRLVLFSLSIVIIYCFNNCSGGGSPDSPSSPPQAANITAPLPITGSESYVLPIRVGCGYQNEPCVSVTVCEPSSNNCRTIPNVLLDTGSSGLRIFSSLLNGLNLTQETDGAGHSIAECQTYADNTSDWGPVATADVRLGGESASQVPIHLINSGFATAPADCPGLHTDISQTGFNGILGVGVFVADCGPGCADTTQPDNRLYFNCTAGATNCDQKSIAVAVAQQVVNPVAKLPMDNNGVIVQLPAVGSDGAATSEGWLILGIGTQTNNTPPAGITALPADATGNFVTSFNGSTYTTAVIDSGSMGLYFPQPAALPLCNPNGDEAGFFCPSSAQTLSAVQIGAGGSSALSVSFQIGNGESLLSQNNVAFNNIGAAVAGTFSWGLPFFFGRTVYVGFEGKTSALGNGSYWAY